MYKRVFGGADILQRNSIGDQILNKYKFAIIKWAILQFYENLLCNFWKEASKNLSEMIRNIISKHSLEWNKVLTMSNNLNLKRRINS